MFITVAMTVAAFNILKAKDENGREIEPVHEFTAGVIRQVPSSRYDTS